MHKKYIFILLVSTFFSAYAQSWQWAKSGGTVADQAAHDLDRENARSIVTDAYGNTYFVSSVGHTGLIIDGVEKEVYGGMTDGLLASFACDGTYRWSKVIGGIDFDQLMGVGTDADGNVYAAGRIQPLQQNDITPVNTHFDNDTILPVSYYDVNTYKKSIFLIKYDTNGSLQWLRMPQRDDISLIESVTMYRCLDLQVDPQGNSYWLCYMGPGTVANGAYTVTGEEQSMHILKYDADGNFIEGIPFPMVATSGALLNFKFHRNHNTGHFYISGSIFFYDGSAESVTINGQPVEHSRYVAAFDENAGFLWIRTNIGNTMWGTPAQGLSFDQDNNIYFTSGAKTQGVGQDSPIDGFNGIAFEPHPSFDNIGSYGFLVKMDSNGNTLWQTCSNRCDPGSVVVNGNEVAVACAAKNLQWQSVSITYPLENTPGLHPFLVRFNKETGTVIEADYVTTTGGDYPFSLSADANGNYYMGGKFTAALTAGNTVYSNGGQYDFFLAKFGSDNCTFLKDAAVDSDGLKAWPNPVKDMLSLNNAQSLVYELYTASGVKAASGHAGINAQINMQGLASGLYILRLHTGNGKVETLKITKE
jgi:hypothetical protein